jgi:hypothetical protein
VKFSPSQVERLEHTFRDTFPSALPSEEDREWQLGKVLDVMQHPDEDQERLFVVEDRKVFSNLDGRQITDTVQLQAEEYYAEELEGPSEFDYDEDTQAFYHPEHGDLVLNRFTYNFSLLHGGNRRGVYADPYCVPRHLRGGGVPAHDDL